MYFRKKSKAAERKSKALFARKVKSSKSLELLVGFEPCNLGKVSRQVESIGPVKRVYEFIPYISFECPSIEARRIMASSSAGYSYLRNLFRTIDAASDFTIPKPVRAKHIASGNWNLENIGAYEAWNASMGEGITIAVIDTGIEYSHPELRDRFGSNKGYDFVENSTNPIDRHGHGTHVAGICSSINYGVAPKSSLFAVRVLDENGSGKESDVIAGIEWAIRNNIQIANMSLGSPAASAAFQDICYVAAQNGLVVVAAAGNNGGEYASYPAAFGEPVIAVAAVDQQNRRADFSNIFMTNDVSAPGVQVTSAYLNGSYATFSGTSMASPHVAGAAALAMAVSSENVYSLIERTAISLGSREEFGAGLVRADRMVQGGSSLFQMIKQLVW